MIDLKKFKKPEIYKEKNLFINVLWYLINNLFFNSFIPGSKLRIIILNLFGADISKSAYIKPRVYFFSHSFACRHNSQIFNQN